MSLLDTYRQHRQLRRSEEHVDILATMTNGERWFGFDLSRRTRIRPGRMYPALSRLMSWGYISDGWEDEALARAEGRLPRRWYRITEDGRLAALLGPFLLAQRTKETKP